MQTGLSQPTIVPTVGTDVYSEQEFVAVLDDVLAALDTHNVAPQQRQEVLAILYSMKNDIVRV